MESRNAIIIALGQPSDPKPHDATMQGLAEKVAARFSGWTIRGATLESPGSLAAAAEGMERPLVYPLFLANGFFMAQVLPKRLARIVPGAEILPPFGEDRAFPQLVGDILSEAAAERGLDPRETSVLLAAHGSEMFPASRTSTEELARQVAALTAFRRIATGYIEEHPFIEESAVTMNEDGGEAICLPVFALKASHVAVDIPAALAKARFRGTVLPPVGMHEAVPAMIAAALRFHVQRAAA